MGPLAARAAALLAAALLPGAPCPGQARLSVAAEADLGGACAFRAEVAGPAARAVAAWRGTEPARGAFALGVSLPWLRVGTLAPTGLLREAANPLGFGAGSGVFREDPSLRLDGSADPSARLGLLVAPVPDRVGLYCIAARRGGTEVGAFASVQPLPGVTVDLLAAAGEPADRLVVDPGGPGAGDWYGVPPAGGLLGLAAARLRAVGPGAEAVLTAGISGGERTAPGRFLHAACGARGGAFSGALLVGLADSRWRCLDGTPASTAARVAGKAALCGPRLRVEAAVGFEQGMPGFDPSAAARPSWNLSAAVEARHAAGRGTARLEAEVSVRAAAGGLQVAGSTCTLQAAGGRETWKARCSLDGFPGGFGCGGCGPAWSPRALEAELQLDPPGVPLWLRLDARLSDLAAGGCLSARSTACFEWKGRAAARAREAPFTGSIRVEAGFADAGLGPGSLPGRLVLGLGWQCRQRPATPSRPPG